eukprot:PhF_6_TR4921/c0_g1_i1/m.6977/K09660/MPDU1; mannose-P-dolichol utilization defect 1
MLIQLLSQVLSFGIVLGSVTVKLPQIREIRRRGSAEGVSPSMVILETISVLTSVGWGINNGLSFWDFGESAFISIQNAVTMGLILGYTSMPGKIVEGCALATGGCLLFLALFCSGAIPPEAQKLLVSSQIFFNIASRVPQIILGQKNKSTGALSFTTFFLSTGGCAARVLTTFVRVSVEAGRNLLIAQFLVATLLNGLILLQIIFYNNIHEKVLTRLGLMKKKLP